jgi:hypothetical protein
MHCQICDEDYTQPSMGGDGICPSCDCGIPPQVKKLTRENNALRFRVLELELELARASQKFSGESKPTERQWGD